MGTCAFKAVHLINNMSDPAERVRVSIFYLADGKHVKLPKSKKLIKF